MTQGIFIHGSRPKSKKQIKEVVEAAQMSYEAQTQMLDRETQDAQIMGGPMPSTHLHDLYCVVIEATAWPQLSANEFDGSLAAATKAKKTGPFTFVGPDPRTSRKFYGTIEYKPNKNDTSKGRWIVK